MFSVFSTDPDGPGPLQPVLLLQGTVKAGTIAALDGFSTASVLSAQVTYNGGIIFDALNSIGGTPTGSLSWSMLDAVNTVTGDPELTIGSNGYVVPFQANATGLFSTPAVPEPTTASILAASALGMLVRRRRSVRV